ncbi:MAG: Mfa1 family fimbria major subunit [Muribaculaceae bacterium]|nr:Mfa1 family fimbria major subunit [Muribaculaceae bacterium]
MKKIYGLAALCAAMTLASCSNNDEPQVVEINNGPAEIGYIGVTIATPDETRATTYEVGTPAENKVTDAMLIVFNDDEVADNRKVLDVVTFKPKTWVDGATNSDIAKTSTTAVAITIPKAAQGETQKVVGEVMCILNPGTFTVAKTSNLTIDQVRKKVENFAAHTEGTFVMSSSAYGTTPKYTTSFKDKVYPTQSEAEDHAQNIYVERVLAKVTWTFVNGFGYKSDATPLKPSIDGTDTELDVVVTGIEMANEASETYLVKDVDQTTYNWPTFTVEGFTAHETYRSHWATPMTDLDKKLTNRTYATIIDGFNMNRGKKSDPYYLYENTLNNANQNTCVLITAQLCKKGTTTGLTLYELGFNGKFYTEDATKGIKVQIANMLYDDNYLKSDGNGGWTKIEPADITFAAAPTAIGDNTTPNRASYRGYAQLNTTTGLVIGKYSPSDGTTSAVTGNLTTVNNYLKTATGYQGKAMKYWVKKWADGKCYYYKDINADEVGFPGVVRNHVYNLDLETVVGMGTPIFDPDKPIIPEKPDSFDPGTPDESYLGAKIHILKWAVYSQGVNFD